MVKLTNKEIAKPFQHDFSPLMVEMFESFERIREAKEELEAAKEHALGSFGYEEPSHYVRREQNDYNQAVDDASRTFLETMERLETEVFFDNARHLESPFSIFMNRPMTYHRIINEALKTKGFEFEFVGDLVMAADDMGATYRKLPAKVKTFLQKVPARHVGEKWVRPGSEG